MLELQKYLQANSTEDLERDYAIKSRRHGDYNNLVLFKYSQIDSPMHERICQESRGIILDESDNWRIICRTFDKFFNIGEMHQAKVDYSKANVWSKLDGSLVQLYFYDNRWHFATSGSPDAAGDVHGSGLSFNELIQQTWNSMGYQYPVDNNLCFAFELTSKYNRVVVRYEDESKLYLLGVRDLNTQKELDISSFSRFYKLCPSVKFDNPTPEFLRSTLTKSGLEEEGYVVCDDNFNRVKIKSEDYVRLHGIKGEGWTLKKGLQLILAEQHDDFITYFPEYKEDIEMIQSKILDIKSQVYEILEKEKNNTDKRDFGIKYGSSNISCFLFQMKWQSKIFEDILKQMSIKNLLILLDLK